MAKLHKNKDPELLVKELKELAGIELSPEELQLLLQSDLERDALEGFAAMKKAGVNGDKALVDLQHQLNQKIKDRSKQSELRWHKLSIAATVAAVVCIGAFYIVKKQRHDREQIAKMADMPIIWTKNDTLVIYLPKEEAIAQNLAKPPSPVSAPIAPTAPSVESPTVAAATALSAPALNEVVIVQDTTAPKNAFAENTFAKRSAVASVAKAKAEEKHVIKLIDILTAKPLTAVDLKIKGTTIIGETDENGEFNIPLSSNKPTIQAAKQGYLPLETSLNFEEHKTLTYGLMPDVKQQAEVSVKEFLKSTKVNTADATFAVSESAYRIYINKNINYPKAFTEMGREGTVQVDFTVLPDGSLTQFKIRQSMGADFDKASIEVLKNGPKWLPAIRNGKPVSGKAHYFVNFIQL
ncbi:hypothetical protein C3K47_00025 [Solitalea longa]|uniref:TonB C-terminal domain-containing protein n=1 Tax=Solitalea longa TaxID=2079460 RepID=A0A2S5A8S5_9SPHI|nr:TonB family protein [Solitalea longa]POY38926.1 hypothetical protein C3K47_00025 [Solitalea longa]